MLTTVGQKGQIVIEKGIRETLGLQPGYIAVQKLIGDHLEVYFYPPEHRQSLRGVLANKIQKKASMTAWSVQRERAWSEAASREAREGDAEGEQ